ncbi:MAG TPA: MDR family MFS transporter [Stellaceae bacterium]|nr:MDR family MFS transporter [Stellaceae bacterium]
MDSEHPAPPIPAVTGSRRWAIASVMATMFMIAIEGTIVATAMPTIVGDLGGFDLFSWVFTGYLLTQAVTIPIYGRLADLFGRKRVLFFGMGVFLAASLLCGLAWGMVPLIVFRMIQGVGAGAIMPVGMTLVADLYPPAERARIQAYVSSVWIIAAIIAPVIGAFLIAHTGWAMVFWVNLPLGLIAWVMLAVSLHERVVRHARRIDYLGSILMVIGSGALMFVLVEASKLSLATVIVTGGCAVSIILVMLLYEFQTREPMLPLGLWRDPVVVGGNLVNLLLGAMLMGVTAFLPPYVQTVMGRTALTAGFMLTAMSASWPTGSAIAGQIMQRTSYRSTAIGGGLLLVLGNALMVAIAPESSVMFVATAALIGGLGMGLANNSFLVAVQSTVAAEDRGVATSSVVFMRMVGQSIGTAVFGGIVNQQVASRIPGGGDIVDRMLAPGFRQTLPLDRLMPLLHEFAAALHNVFLIDLVLAMALVACCALLPPGLSPVRPARRR